MSGSFWSWIFHLSSSPDDDVIWFVGRVVIESSWLDWTGQKDVANESGPESGLCSATMSNNEITLDDNNDRRGEPKNPEREWKGGHPNQMVGEIQFLRDDAMTVDNDLSAE